MKKCRIGLTASASIILLLHYPIFGQSGESRGEPKGKDFVERLSRTSDMLFYDANTSCLMDRSPLSVFDGYLLGANPDEQQWHVQSVSPGSGPVYYEKNYSATWKITGDTLYLVDLNPIFVPSCEESDSVRQELFAAVKEATGLRLENDAKPLASTWFSGHLRIKRTRMATESYLDWIDSPFYEITVEKGRITASRRVGMQKPSPASDRLKKRMKTGTRPSYHWKPDKKNRSELSSKQLGANDIVGGSNARGDVYQSNNYRD